MSHLLFSTSTANRQKGIIHLFLLLLLSFITLIAMVIIAPSPLPSPTLPSPTPTLFAADPTIPPTPTVASVTPTPTPLPTTLPNTPTISPPQPPTPTPTLQIHPTSPPTEGNTLITQGVTYANSSANFSRSRSSKAQVPENLIGPHQGWVAIRYKTGFSANTNLSPDPIMWDLSESDPSDLFIYYDIDSDKFHFSRRRNGSGTNLSSPTQVFTAGDDMTLIGTWTNNTIAISINGGSFVSRSNTSIPQQAPFFIGSSERQNSAGVRQPNSDYYWVAAGTETLTNADAAAIHAFGNADRPRLAFPGNATFVWWANDNRYNND